MNPESCKFTPPATRGWEASCNLSTGQGICTLANWLILIANFSVRWCEGCGLTRLDLEVLGFILIHDTDSA